LTLSKDRAKKSIKNEYFANTNLSYDGNNVQTPIPQSKLCYPKKVLSGLSSKTNLSINKETKNGIKEAKKSF